MESNDNLTDFLEKTIYHWVGKNFGSQEAEDPSWSIEALSSYLAKELARRNGKKDNLVPHELTILFRTDCADIDKEVGKITSKIKEIGGETAYVERDGEKKRLAYNINGEEFAVYFYFDIMIPRDAPATLSAWLNIKDTVLRYLLVRKDTRR